MRAAWQAPGAASRRWRRAHNGPATPHPRNHQAPGQPRGLRAPALAAQPFPLACPGPSGRPAPGRSCRALSLVLQPTAARPPLQELGAAAARAASGGQAVSVQRRAPSPPPCPWQGRQLPMGCPQPSAAPRLAAHVAFTTHTCQAPRWSVRQHPGGMPEGSPARLHPVLTVAAGVQGRRGAREGEGQAWTAKPSGQGAAWDR